MNLCFSDTISEIKKYTVQSIRVNWLRETASRSGGGGGVGSLASEREENHNPQRKSLLRDRFFLQICDFVERSRTESPSVGFSLVALSATD